MYCRGTLHIFPYSFVHATSKYLKWKIFFIRKYRVCPRASYFYEELTLGEGPGLQRGTACPWRLWSTFLVRITGLTGLSWMPADVPFPSVWHISIVECFAESPCSTVELWGSGLYLCSWPRSNNEREGNSGSSRDKRGNFNDVWTGTFTQPICGIRQWVVIFLILLVYVLLFLVCVSSRLVFWHTGVFRR